MHVYIKILERFGHGALLDAVFGVARLLSVRVTGSLEGSGTPLFALHIISINIVPPFPLNNHQAASGGV